MNRFLQALANLFRIEELRKRVLFTLALLAVYRIGAHIPTPGINGAVLDQIFSAAQGTALGIFDLFSGGNFRRLTIFALGIMPYITSSIILQLMTVVFPYLERLQKEGELGRRKITQYTRYLTIVLSIIQSLTIAKTLQAAGGVMGGQSSYLPLRVNSGGVIPPIFASSLLAFPATAALIFGTRWPFVKNIADALKWGEPLYTLIYITLILVFAFFYVGIVFNPTELADNMRKNGGFIPGIRPGRTTSEHVSKILKRLTFIGAVYLALVCLLPEWMIAGIHLDHLGWGIGSWFDRHFPLWFLKGLGVQFYFGGTSLLIVVGVAMGNGQQLEAQLVMRNYEGFARKGRLRGRR